MKTTLISALALTVAALPLAAQPMGGPGGDMRPGFEEFDADGDGSVTRAEVDAFRAGRFAEVDADGDGSVTREEFTAHVVARATERAAEMFERLDADGDGALSRDALEARGPGGALEGRIFAMLDADGDGAIAREEHDAAMERRAGMHEEHGRKGMGGRGGDRDHGGRWFWWN